jgi:hypothetical protein
LQVEVTVKAKVPGPDEGLTR